MSTSQRQAILRHRGPYLAQLESSAHRRRNIVADLSCGEKGQPSLIVASDVSSWCHAVSAEQAVCAALAAVHMCHCSCFVTLQPPGPTYKPVRLLCRRCWPVEPWRTTSWRTRPSASVSCV